ncbi:MAG: hypothetical protein KDA24_08650 [Deltaproteobacteria bacterium]|nr:hypothetical protein [Deltaproteobacteria bacterium]
MADSTDDAVISGTPQVFFLRNPEVPTTYSPLVDVRVGQNGLHLLSFVPPAAAPADLEMRNGQPSIVVRSHSEIMVPLDGVERLIRDLCSQFRATLVNRIRKDAEANGLEMPPDEEIVFNGMEDIFAVGRARPASDDS